jgi:hypothetical protein
MIDLLQAGLPVRDPRSRRSAALKTRRLGGSGEKRSGLLPRASERLDSENAVIKSKT